MVDSAESIILDFMKSLDFPGIRLGETNAEVCNYLKENGYRFTPDLVAGPTNIKDAEIEGLFFIDVIKPTSDLLFKSEFYKGYKIDVPNIFKNRLLATEYNKEFCLIDTIPIIHHEFYLDSLNNKLDKYAHQRKVQKNGSQFVSANLGIVHHFNLGALSENNHFDSETIITLLDYIRFYKRLGPSDNIDLKNAENIILNEIIDMDQIEPCFLAVGRDVPDLPCLFLMLHISIIKKFKRRDIALVVLNIPHLDNSDGQYPVHNWFKKLIFHPRSIKYQNDKFEEKKITIKLINIEKLFT